MKCELNRLAIVDSFKTSLKDMAFIKAEDHASVGKWLDELCGTKTRFEKARTAGELWKFLFRSCLGAITANGRGISEVCRYVDEAIEYEDILFALDTHHREHVIHSIWVMLLGLHLKSHSAVFESLECWEALGRDAQSDASSKGYDAACEKLRSLVAPLWCLIALTHDLGYPIEKTKIANGRMAGMIRNFGFLSQKDFEYDFTVIHEPAISELLGILSSGIACQGVGRYQLYCSKGTRLDYSKTFEHLDHGIMSAYLLQNTLDWICDTLAYPSSDDWYFTNVDSVVQPVLVITLLDAISSHTNRNSYAHRLDLLSELLFLCDELEEFSRFCRSSKTHEWAERQVRTELELEKDMLHVTYTFQDTETQELDEEDDVRAFFQRKVRKLHRRYELSADGIKELSVVCKDVTKAHSIECTYKKGLGTELTLECSIGEKKEAMSLLRKELF